MSSGCRQGAKALLLAVMPMAASTAAVAQELVVMPFACRASALGVVLTPSDNVGHRVVSRRETTTFTACSPARPDQCRRWTVHRFDMDCSGVPVPWTDVVAAYAEGPRQSWVKDGVFQIRMPNWWGLAPGDPCARGFDPVDRWRPARTRPCVEHAQELAIVSFPRGFAPTFGIDAIFVPQPGGPPVASSRLPVPSAPPPPGPTERPAVERGPIDRGTSERSAEKPSERAAVERPAAEKPAVEKPVAEKPSPEKQAEKQAKAAPAPSPMTAPAPAKAPPADIASLQPSAPSPNGTGSHSPASDGPDGKVSRPIVPTIINAPPEAPALKEEPKAVDKSAVPAARPPEAGPASSPASTSASASVSASASSASEAQGTLPVPSPKLPKSLKSKSEPSSSPETVVALEPEPAPRTSTTLLLAAATGTLALLAALGLIVLALRRRPAAPVERDLAAVRFHSGRDVVAAPPGQAQDVRSATPPPFPGAAFDRVPESADEAFAVLGMGAGPQADLTAIKKLVDALRFNWHPDRATDDSDRDMRVFRLQQINAAWDILSKSRPTPRTR